jgi:hypothetical protein
MPLANGYTQLGVSLSPPYRQISLAEYYTTEWPHNNCYTNGVNKTQIIDSWCPGTTGTIDHMLFDCPSVTAFWNRLPKILHELLHSLQKRLILYGSAVQRFYTLRRI